MSIKKTALVLQGGGALGAYEFGVIKALFEYDIKPEIITGVSIGAYNAAVLAGAKDNNPIDSLERFWLELMPIGGLMGAIIKLLPSEKLKQIVQITGNPNIPINLKVLIPFLSATSIYSNKPLRKALEEVIDFDRLNSTNAPHTVVNAVNVQTGELTHFENKNGNRITIDHVMASGSIAPAYPAIKIQNENNGENYYWDGGLFNNTPLSKAIHLLQSDDENSLQKVERELIVAELFPKEIKNMPEDLEQVLDRVIELLCASKINLDLKFFKRMTSYIELIQLIDKKLPHDEEGNKIRELEAYDSLLNRRKKIDRHLVVTLRDHETALGVLDSSRDALKRRINSGYDDTVLALKNSDFLSTRH